MKRIQSKRKIKTLLVNPRFDGRYHGFPLGTAYIAAYLQQNKIDVSIIDEDALISIGLSKEQIKEKIREINPDVVGISITSPNYKNALELVNVVKENTNSKIIVGGPHPTFCYETILEYHPEIDYVVVGEGEESMLELVTRIKSSKGIEDIFGVAYRKDNEIVLNRRPLKQNLDELPSPKRDLFFTGDRTLDKKIEEHYNVKKGIKSTTMMTSRGCGYACSYCASNSLWGKIRHRSVENVLDEIEELYNKGYRYVYFEDDSFTLKSKQEGLAKERIIQFCKGLEKRGINILWGCGTTTDAIGEEILRRMKKVGCEFIYFGVESASQEILNKIGKNVKIKDVEKAYDIVEKVGIHAIASMQFGLEGEDDKTIDETIKWLKKMEDKYRCFNFIVSFNSLWPGAPLTRKAGITGEHFEPAFDKSKTNFQFIEFNGIKNTFTHYGGTYHSLSKKKIIEIHNKLIEVFGERDFGQFVYKT